jgi:dihydroorotase
MVQTLLIRGARLLDPSDGTDRVGDLLIVNGRIARAGDVPQDCRIVDGDGLIACPGLIDLHCHLREPGYEDKETILTGAQAAARGGFTTICCMPNTNPPIDSAGTVEFVKSRAREANLVKVLPIGCVSKGRAGVELAELWELAQAGVVGFSDDGSPVGDPNLMRQALSYASSLNAPVIDHCEERALTRDAVVNEGAVSNRLGLTGWPGEAEESMVARDIALAELTGGRLHLAHLTTARSVELVADAKKRGLRVTAETTPHHVTLTEEWVLGHEPSGPLTGPLTAAAYDPTTKVNPPLRTERDRKALVAGLRSGVIDAIATDHAPQTFMGKVDTYQAAEWGISGLETALGALLGLVHRGELELTTLVARLTTGPAMVLGDAHRDLATLREGSTADIVLIDPAEKWVVTAQEFVSKGKHSPLEGTTLRGRAVLTLVGGRPVYSSLAGVAVETNGSGR